MYKALGSLASCSSPGEKAVAKAENRSSGSVMFSKCFSSFISFGAIVLRLLFVVLYNWYIISFTCIILSNIVEYTVHIIQFESTLWHKTRIGLMKNKYKVLDEDV